MAAPSTAEICYDVYIINNAHGDGKMVQQLITHVLAEDPGSSSSSQPSVTTVLRDLMPCDLHSCYAWSWFTDKNAGKYSYS